jgi:preprotein translocase subunit YajC
MDWLASAAEAAGVIPGTGAGGSGAGGGMMGLLPLVLMFAIFYFLLIRPQQKKAKQHKEMLNNLKRGDSIITTGGIYGRIVDVSDNSMNVEVADKVRIKIAKGFVHSLAGSGQEAAPPLPK